MNKKKVEGLKVIDLSGEKINKWTVLRYDYENLEFQKQRVANKEIKSVSHKFVCKCDCGTIRSVGSTHLANNKTSSCGCVTKEAISLANSKPKTKSFQQWCLDNKHQDYLDLWDYKLNDKLPNEVSFASNKKFYFKCLQGLHESELKTPNVLTDASRNLSLKCKKCGSLGLFILDSFGKEGLEKMWDFEKNKNSPFDISKTTRKEKCWFKCNNGVEYHVFDMYPSEFQRGQRCPFCSGARLHEKDSFGATYPDFIKERWSDKNTTSPLKISKGTQDKIWIKCLNGVHDDYQTTCGDLIRRGFHRCPKCSQERRESYLQESVRRYIESLGYTILHEYSCTIRPISPKTKLPLPFDNEIKELKLIIEVHGEQHYKVVSWHKNSANRKNSTPEVEFLNGKIRDRYKNYIAWKSGYEVLYLPFWLSNREEEWKRAIDNKIMEIQNKNKKECDN